MTRRLENDTARKSWTFRAALLPAFRGRFRPDAGDHHRAVAFVVDLYREEVAGHHGADDRVPSLRFRRNVCAFDVHARAAAVIDDAPVAGDLEGEFDIRGANPHVLRLARAERAVHPNALTWRRRHHAAGGACGAEVDRHRDCAGHAGAVDVVIGHNPHVGPAAAEQRIAWRFGRSRRCSRYHARSHAQGGEAQFQFHQRFLPFQSASCDIPPRGLDKRGDRDARCLSQVSAVTR